MMATPTHPRESSMKKSLQQQGKGLFAEAASSGKRELVLRKDAVTEKVVKAIEEGEDLSLFTVATLNNLQLNGFSGVAHLSRVASLTALLQLGLTENQLESLPHEIGSLPKLKLLDVSQNQLSSLPSSLFLLPSLQTLILASNSLTDSSFSVDLSGEVLPSLHQLDVTGNQLTALPSFLSHTPQLAELRVAHNSLSSLHPTLIQSLAGLRVLEAHENQLLTLPHELAGCSKLKSVRLEANPLRDRRLLKLVTQHGTHKPKAVLDYLASRAPQPPPAGKKEGKKKGKSVVRVESEEEDNDVEFSLQPPEVVIVRPELGKGLEVVATGNARKVRPYLVCTVMRGVSLATEESMRQFISLQTKLHDTVCKRRRSATIATHDLAKISPPISYLVASATDVSMAPLGWSEEVKVQQFLAHVEANKPGSGGRRAKGVDTAAASLFKYLQYVSSEEMVFLQDSSGTVISLPPLTNSHNTKVSGSTTDLLVEVTSSESLLAAKTAMDSLVVGVASVMSGGVRLEQVKVVDESGQLLVLYPSRTDLASSPDIRVTRPL